MTQQSSFTNLKKSPELVRALRVSHPNPKTSTESSERLCVQSPPKLWLALNIFDKFKRQN